MEELIDYHFSREGFVKTFREVFSDDEIDGIEMYCQSCKCFYNFLLYYKDDSYYIIHFDSGTIISWYKHLGRANTCNNKAFNIFNLKEMLKELKEDINVSI